MKLPAVVVVILLTWLELESCCCLTAIGPYNHNYGVIQFFGIFTRSSSAGAEAARLAVADINAHNTRVGLSLRVDLIEDGDTECGVKVEPVDLLSRLMTQDEHVSQELMSQNKPILLAGCHSDCVQLSQAATHYDAVTMCYGERSGKSGLRSMSASELFFLEPDLSSVVIPLLKLFRHFKWRKVAVISFFGDPLAQLGEQLAHVLDEHEMQVGRLEGSNPNSLGLIQLHNFRILVVLVGTEMFARELLCRIYLAGLTTTTTTSNSYVWIFIGPNGRHDWVIGGSTTNCSIDHLMMAAESHLNLSPIIWHPDPTLCTISNRTVTSFKRVMMERILSKKNIAERLEPDFNEAPLAYDAVWSGYIAVAISLLECGNSVDGGGCPLKLDDTLNMVTFPGVSGPVSFREGKRSVAGVTIRVDQFKRGRYEQVAFHFNGNNSWAWSRPYPFGSVTPGDGFGVGELPLPELESPAPQPPTTPQNIASVLHSSSTTGLLVILLLSIRILHNFQSLQLLRN